MPTTVVAKMSNNTTKEVSVTWNPNTIDTSTPGEKTVNGAVEGYNGTVTYTVIVEAVVEKGIAHISLYKDSTSSTDKIDFENITNFYLVNLKTGNRYEIGTTPWNNTNVFQMKDIPEGQYTIHFETPEGMSVERIELGESYKETVYDVENNPFIIVKDKSNYVKIVLKSAVTLKEIKPLKNLKVNSNISYDKFLEKLPKQTTVVDSKGQEHLVDLKWDVRPFTFESWKKPGQYSKTSEFFKLPVNISNSESPKRLEVNLNITFK